MGADIDANDFTILNLPEPINLTDAVPKHYVNNMKCTEGVVPALESNSSKTGFYCIASSQYNATYEACNVFKMVYTTSWATLSINSNFWFKVYCPQPVRIWKFALSGRDNVQRIYNWRLEGSNDNFTFDILYTAVNTYIDQQRYDFEVGPNQPYYKWYRLFVINA